MKYPRFEVKVNSSRLSGRFSGETDRIVEGVKTSEISSKSLIYDR